MRDLARNQGRLMNWKRKSLKPNKKYCEGKIYLTFCGGDIYQRYTVAVAVQ